MCNHGFITCPHTLRGPRLLWLYQLYPSFTRNGGISGECHVFVMRCTANLSTTIMDFRGFDSDVIVILRVGIPRPLGNLPEASSQAILAGIILVGPLGVWSFGLQRAPSCLVGVSTNNYVYISLFIHIYIYIYTYMTASVTECAASQTQTM